MRWIKDAVSLKAGKNAAGTAGFDLVSEVDKNTGLCTAACQSGQMERIANLNASTIL
jgi:hypothetical protein